MIPLFRPYIAPSADKAILDVLHSGMLAEGKVNEQFEQKLEEYLGYPVLTVNSGTSALAMLYDLADIQRGDMVISTPITCAATNLELLRRGAHVLWADVDDNGLIDVKSVHRLLHQYPNVRAVVGVDYGGLLCDHSSLHALATAYGAKFIVDSAQTFGASHEGRMVGNDCFGIAFSFQAIKHLTTGDGGAFAVRHLPHKMEEGRLKRWFGLDRRAGGFRCEQDIKVLGGKFHLNDISASLGLANLEVLPAVLAISRSNAQYYQTELSGIDGLELPVSRDGDEPSWWSFIIRTERPAMFIEFLKSRGVESAKIHTRNDTKTVFRDFSKMYLPGVSRFDSRQVSIPVGAHVDKHDRQEVVYAVKEYFEK